MLSRWTAAALMALALPAAAQVVPAANYTDMWYLPTESGWGVSFTQHAGSNQVFAVWYTYDPRVPDSANAGRFKPLWIVMPGGTWSSPTQITGNVYVTDGNPFSVSGSNTHATNVGTFSFNFTTTASASFTYQIAAPAGLASTDPAFGLPSFSGSKSLSRQSF